MPEGGKKDYFSYSARWDATFQPSTSMFSPGTPPISPDPQPIRRIDFPAGVNLQWTPRGYEPFGFPELRSFANVELVRLAIETRKDQIERLDWKVKVKDGRKSRTDADERIRKVEKFFRKPDGVTHFASWFRVVVEDMLSIDAATVERRKNRAGGLIGLDYVDGSTIKVLIDATGRIPRPPAPAYQQVIKGRVWNDLTTEDIIYAPRNMRSNHMYGFGPVEQIIVTINTLLRRQTQQLAYFTEGNVPQGLVNVPDGWTVDQVREYQEFIDSRLSGNLAERSKLIWAPFGSKYQAIKESPIKDEFDEWLARVVAFCFSLPPTPFIKQMNRATAQSDQDRALEEGLEPLLCWGKRLLDSVIQDDMGFYDLEWSWETARDIDPLKQAQIDDMRLRNGSLLLNEARDNDGREAYVGYGDQPLIYTATGVVPVPRAIELAMADPAEEEPTNPEKDGQPGQKSPKGN